MLTAALWWLWIWGWLLNSLPVPAENIFAGGNERYFRNDYEQAERLYLRCTETARLAQAAYYNAGNAAYERGAYADAVAYFEEALERNPEDEDAWFNLELAKRHLKRSASSQAGSSPQLDQPPAAKPRKSPAVPSKITRLYPEQSLNDEEADRILAQARRNERVVRFYRPSPGQGRNTRRSGDIFTQSPEELLETMREQTRAGYPFKPGSSLVKPKVLPDEVDW